MSNHEWIHLLKDCSLAFQMPVFMVNDQPKMIYHYPDHLMRPPQFVRDSNVQYVKESKKHPFRLRMYSDEFMQSYFLYTIKRTDIEVVLGIGPFLSNQIGKKKVKARVAGRGLAPDVEETLLHYFDQLSVLSESRIKAIEHLLVQILPRPELSSSFNEQAQMRRQLNDYSRTVPAYSEAVAAKEKFQQLFLSGSPEAVAAYANYKKLLQPTHSDRDEIRSAKNQLIRLITELGNWSIEAGSQPDEIMSLNDFYLNYLETRETLGEVEELEQNVLRSFLERIGGTNEMLRSSPLVERTKRYIFENLGRHLTLKKIADAMNVNPNYLSGIFAREVGVAITHFINQQRIEEAKELLSITNYSLLEISTLLGYNSQSYFTRVFKGVEGIGPKEFRKKYQTYED
ncbi:UNVERIFIED_CONTAM: AraC family transcriptional regulator [Halobacillus marinus]